MATNPTPVTIDQPLGLMVLHETEFKCYQRHFTVIKC